MLNKRINNLEADLEAKKQAYNLKEVKLSTLKQRLGVKWCKLNQSSI